MVLVSSIVMSYFRSITAIWATYFFFLIFAQFAFLTQVKYLDPSQLEPIMATMGGVGLLCSFLCARYLKTHQPLSLLRWGFLICALVSGVCPFLHSTLPLLLVSAGIGLGLSLVTVSLATGLSQLTGPKRFGLKLGLGVGLAYFSCNLPFIFEADPHRQAWYASLVCLLGLVAVTGANPTQNELEFNNPSWQKYWFAPRGFITMVLVFFALIWMDSALFYVIQENASLKNLTWGSRNLGINALVHLAMAILAGLALDRGYLRSLLAGAYLLLTVGALILAKATVALDWASSFYVAGVSLYSVALVAVPSLWREQPGSLPRAWRSAWLYGVAGWVGSAMGIGMARDLAHIPLLFLILTGLVILTCGWVNFRQERLAVLALLVLPACSTTPPQTASAEERGRQVYIAEGCIHCHSQYVRPEDAQAWGPATDLALALAQQPPLLGNRRIGPDLAEVGNRRSRQWQELHLRDPRAMTRTSNMPAYNHLFEDERGNDLVSYLMSLGANTYTERLALNQAWPAQMPEQNAECDPKVSGQLYLDFCAGCHGSGKDLGPLAQKLEPPVRNLNLDPFRYFDESSPTGPTTLARIIKFGIPGASMPGHEYFSDAEAFGLAKWVLTRRHQRENH